MDKKPNEIPVMNLMKKTITKMTKIADSAYAYHNMTENQVSNIQFMIGFFQHEINRMKGIYDKREDTEKLNSELVEFMHSKTYENDVTDSFKSLTEEFIGDLQNYRRIWENES